MLTTSTPKSTRIARVAALVGGLLLCGATCTHLVRSACGCKSKAEVAQMVVRKMASVTPEWSQAHAGACPTAADIVPYLNDPEAKDPWGALYRVRCGADAPDGARGIAVDSAGPDGQFETDDDIGSWR